MLAYACLAGLRLRFGSGVCCLWVRSWRSTVQLIHLPGESQGLARAVPGFVKGAGLWS